MSTRRFTTKAERAYDVAVIETRDVRYDLDKTFDELKPNPVERVARTIPFDRVTVAPRIIRLTLDEGLIVRRTADSLTWMVQLPMVHELRKGTILIWRDLWLDPTANWGANAIVFGLSGFDTETYTIADTIAANNFEIAAMPRAGGNFLLDGSHPHAVTLKDPQLNGSVVTFMKLYDTSVVDFTTLGRVRVGLTFVEPGAHVA